MNTWAQLLLTMLFFNLLLHAENHFKHFTIKRFLTGVFMCVFFVFLFEALIDFLF